jgi:dTDP-4-dehydrorhamnose 3,5-epimerase
VEITVTKTPLDGVVFIDTRFFQDDRGFFMEAWHERDYAAAGLSMRFVQDSHSRSHRGVLRGLHYQDMTAPLGKLIRCTIGEIFDVAVDLRAGSPSFGKFVSVHLTADNKRQMYVPVGFAHGFQALTDVVEVQYRQTGYYSPAAEGSVLWSDPDVGVNWPIPNPTLSTRDRNAITLKEYAANPAFRYGQT